MWGSEDTDRRLARSSDPAASAGGGVRVAPAEERPAAVVIGKEAGCVEWVGVGCDDSGTSSRAKRTWRCSALRACGPQHRSGRSPHLDDTDEDDDPADGLTRREAVLVAGDVTGCIADRLVVLDTLGNGECAVEGKQADDRVGSEPGARVSVDLARGPTSPATTRAGARSRSAGGVRCVTVIRAVVRVRREVAGGDAPLALGWDRRRPARREKPSRSGRAWRALARLKEAASFEARPTSLELPRQAMHLARHFDEPRGERPPPRS